MLHRNKPARSRSKKILFTMIGMCTALAPLPGYAADVLPLGALDTSDSARVATPASLEKGSVVIKSTMESMQHVDVLQGQGTADSRILRMGRSKLLFGFGLSRRVSLTLGLSGTTEDLAASQRLSLFSRDIPASPSLSGGLSRPTAAMDFAGASLAVKLSLVNRAERGGLSLALMPFIESGAGEKGTYALSRAVGPSGGAALLVGMGSSSTGEVVTQLGVRYRSPESSVGLMLRHELFYKAYASLPLHGSLSVFGEGEGRQLMVAALASDETHTRHYKPTYGGDGRLGLALHSGNITVSAFSGRRLGPSSGIGFASRSYGASVSISLGASPKGKKAVSYATTIERDEERKARIRQPKNSRVVPAAQYDDSFSEMIGAEIDPLEVLGPDGAPDFKDVKKKMAEERRNAGVESDETRIERELIELKEAEAKAAQEREKEKAKDDAKARARARKQTAEENEQFKKWVDEANDELKEFEGIQPEDMQWNGLE